MRTILHLLSKRGESKRTTLEGESPVNQLKERSTCETEAEVTSVAVAPALTAPTDVPPIEQSSDVHCQPEVSQRLVPNLASWQGMDEAVVGLAHRAQNTPCQDVAIAQHTPRPYIVLADGAGSAAISDIGAQAVVTGIARLVHTLEGQWATLLDDAESEEKALAAKWPMLLVKHARGILSDTAKIHRRDIRDLRCTLLCVIVGQKRLMWFKVGDGEIVAERTGWDEAQVPTRHCHVLGERGKGDFANQTTFIDIAKPEDVQWGIEDIQGLSGLVAMSDGAAERLVATDGSKVAPRVSTLLDELRKQKLKRQYLTQLFYSPEFCERSSGDDRSMALLASAIAPPPKQPKQPVSSTAPIIESVLEPAGGNKAEKRQRKLRLKRK